MFDLLPFPALSPEAWKAASYLPLLAFRNLPYATSSSFLGRYLLPSPLLPETGARGSTERSYPIGKEAIEGSVPQTLFLNTQVQQNICAIGQTQIVHLQTQS